MENIILSSDEDITEFTDEEQVRVNFVNIELKQKCWLDGEKREFMIFNGKHCYQKVQFKRGGKKKFRINLSYLHAIPELQVKYAYYWYGVSATLFLIAVLSGSALLSGAVLNPIMAGSLAVVSTLVGVATLVLGYNKSTSRIVFSSHYGRAPILELINGSPDHKTFVTFIDVLQQKISSFNKPRNNNLREYLLEELNELRRLKNESVLSSSVFNAAMKNIISNPDYKL